MWDALSVVLMGQKGKGQGYQGESKYIQKRLKGKVCTGHKFD